MKSIRSLNLITFLLVQIWSCEGFTVKSLEIPGPIQHFNEYEETAAYVNGLPYEISMYFYNENPRCVALVRKEYLPLAIVHFGEKCPELQDLDGQLAFKQERDGTFKMGIWQNKEDNPWTLYTIPRNFNPTLYVDYDIGDLDKEPTHSCAGADWKVDKTWKKSTGRKKYYIKPNTFTSTKSTGDQTNNPGQSFTLVMPNEAYADQLDTIQPGAFSKLSREEQEEKWLMLSERQAKAMEKLAMSIDKKTRAAERKASILERIATSIQIVAAAL